MLTPDQLLLTPNKLLLTLDEMTTTKASAKKRAAMSKQSPYSKSVVKAGKTVPRRKHCSAKEVALVAKSVQGKQTPTKAARLDAKARARAWAKRELGQKRKGSQSQSRPQVSAAASGRSVSAKDEEDVVSDLTESESMNKEMVKALDQIGKSDNRFIVDDISEDVFYDALEFLEEEESREDVVVEDASDDDDEEIRNLRSTINNQMPTKYWMEPVGVLYSDVVGMKKPDP